MSAPAHAREALRQLQALLESVHGVRAPPAADFLIDDARRVRLSPGSSPDEALLVQQGQECLGDLSVALFLSDEVLAQLDRGPDAPWTHARLQGFCQAAEGLSHFVYLNHRAAHDAPVSLLELEAQGEVDKYLCVLLQLWARGRHTASAMLRRHLFQEVHFRGDLTGPERERYRLANALAAGTAKVLEARYVVQGRLEALLREVRRLYRLSGGEKLSALAQGAWG